MIRRRILPAAGFAALLVGVSACGGSAGSGDTTARKSDFCKPLTKTEKVSFGSSPSLALATSAQAEGGGYYKNEKLDVKASTFATGQDVIALVGRGQLDAAMVGYPANIFSAVDRGVDVRIVSSAGQNSADNPSSAVYVRSDLMKNGAVSGISDLKGKRIGIAGAPGSGSYYLIGRVLQKGGLKLADVKHVSLSTADMNTAFETKSIDAALVITPFNAAIDNSGVAEVLSSQGALTRAQATGMIMGPNLLKKRPQVACALLRANINTVNKELAPGYSKRPEVVQRFTDLAKFPKDLVESTPESIYDPTLAVDKKQLEQMQLMFIEQGSLDLKAPLPYAEVVDIELREQVVKSLGQAPQ
ncbi:ABC transporter substrate-binding protein [Streptomyces albipurpureus]|uniref:ABC transporter substrate-binding protein n=1 Tax=Streptomyces albipurpureus TaxID=2897419 RepID=A0ABT0UTI1_9ACTN|nr:ABC transporter substrate-binding protein [Streptomyces sp. CWNU-1]MCM2391682.1 ABC transporter substrate-binding protein [Streptomyces sp. CWNU-1]